jgi:hypothetical protein
MRGLIIKDFINLKKNFKILSLLLILYGTMAFFQENVSFFGTIYTLLFAILTISTYSYDELAKWDTYVLTMPVTKKNIVQGKYLIMLLMTGLGSLFSIFFMVIINVLLKKANVFSGIETAVLGASIVIIFYCITIPFIVKLGVEKARLIFFAVYFIPFIITIFAGKAVKNGSMVIPESIIKLGKQFFEYRFILIPIIILTALVVSFTISLRIYQKKEF